MCGIIGYVGFRNARDVLLEGLKRLEYRGYDSAGIGVITSEGLKVFKDKGEIDLLKESIPKFESDIGIGHTRWATHGRVCKENAHPHISCDSKFAIVHNGIIENFQDLKEELEKKGHRFSSDTDTEVIVHLIEENYKGDLKRAVMKSVKRLKGSYAILVISEYEKDKIIGARKDSPLVIGVGDNENFLASDIPAFLKFTNRVKYLLDEELCVITRDGVSIFDLSGKEISREERRIEWDIKEAEKSGYTHYMLKEIFEQPHSLAETLRGRISEIEPFVEIGVEDVGSIERITIVACGTSYYAGLAGKYIIERLAEIPVNVELSSEYRYYGNKNGTVIAVTQSGETADTLAALREAKRAGCRTVAIVNVVGSSATRLADDVILMRSGPEIGVAATKTFTSQLLVLFLLAVKIGIKKGVLDAEKARRYLAEIKRVPELVREVLEKNDEIRSIAEWIKDFSSIFFIGRGIGYPIALEGALKMKEISYIHAEGFAAGELKHGPFALLTKNTPVVAVMINDESYEKILSNIAEIKSRGSPVVAITEKGDSRVREIADTVIEYPETLPMISSIPIAVILQLLAYHTAELRGCPIDKPRNLAKSVTVE
ncbi:MAG: glutamine--fructose-6-phosphate transaminase (isomerizing) [Thermoplasmata archaeon]|nr:MAG: glutamine--fructose-6-phosphate transaminase (isomerizing) [Thermoplasmata archaeon]